MLRRIDVEYSDAYVVAFIAFDCDQYRERDANICIPEWHDK